MPFIQENNIIIDIGLNNQYKIIQFSDVHAVTYENSDSKEIIEEAIKNEKTWLEQKKEFAKGAGENFDESHNISSKQCLINLINYANKEKPSGVVLTGDIIDYYTESNFNMLLEQCGNINYPFVFACGNHESPVERYIDLTCDEDGFTVLEFNEFKIVSLDDSTKRVSKYALDGLKRELRGKKPIIIAMHIPICTQFNKEKMIKYGEYFSIDEDCEDKYTKEFVNILVNNDKIKAILCGHVHGTNESYFAENKKQYCCSSGLIGYVNKIIVK